MNKISAGLSVKVLPVGQMQANCYIVSDVDKKALIIDPGDDGDFIVNTIKGLGVVPEMILATHGHFDHIMAALHVQAVFNIPFILHKEDVFLVSRMQETAGHFLGYQTEDPPPVVSGHLEDGQIISVGAMQLKVLHTPGHTPGSCSFVCAADSLVFVGDTLFAGGGVGRYDFSYSDKEKLFASVRALLVQDPGTRLFAGHGEASTVAQEKQYHRV